MSGSGIRSAASVLTRVEMCAVLLTAALFAAPVRAEDRLETLRVEFHNQSDAVKRAKLFPKLGDALMAEMRKLESAHQYDPVAPLFLEYRDSAAQAYNGLVASGRDAEKHPGGFRELEMYLRRSLHALDELVFGLPFTDREALRGPQKDIEDLDDKLVKALFPRGSDSHKTPPSAPQAHPPI